MASKDLVVRLLGDASGLNKALGQVGNDAAHIGKTLTRTITPAAAAVAVALTKIGSDFNDARDAIIVGTGASGEALEGLIDSAKKVAGQVPNSFGDVGKAIADFNTRLGLTGTELEEAAKQALNLSRITKTDVETNVRTVTRVMQDWGIESTKASQTMDLMFKSSQLTGIGFQRLGDLMVQFGAPLRQIGFSVEETTALFSLFEKQGVNTETVMAGLRRALSNMARAGEEPVEAFRRTVQAIKDAGSAGEANTLALELFGARAGPDMAAAIREGRFEIDELVSQLQDTEGAIQQAADGTLRLSDRFAILRNKITAVLGPFGEIGGAIAGAVAGIGPLIFGVSTLTPALGSLITMVKGLNVAMLANPWVLAAAGIAALVAISPELRSALGNVLSVLGDVASNVMSSLKPALEALGRVLGDVARAVGEQLGEAFRALEPLLTAFAQAIGDLVSTVLPPMIDAFVATVDTIVRLQEGIDGVLQSLEPFPGMTNAAGEQVGLFGIITGAATDAINPFSGAIDAAGFLTDLFGSKADEAADSASSLGIQIGNVQTPFEEMALIADLTARSTDGFKMALDDAGLSSEEFANVTSAAAKAAQDALTREFGKIEAAAQSLARETEAAASSAANSFLKLSDEGKKNVNTFVDETISGAMRLAGFQNNVTTIAGLTSGDFAKYLLAMGLDAEDLVSDLADPAKTAELKRAYDAWTAATEVAQKDMSKEFAKVDPAFKKTLDGVAGLTESELKAIAKIAQREGEAVGRDMINGMNAGVIARSPQLAREVREAVRRAIDAGKQQAGVRSPSTVAAKEIGRPLAEGVAVGIAQGASDVDQAMQAAVDQAIVPVAAQPAGQLVGAGVASGPSYQITVNAGMGADGADIGRRIVEEIRKFERFNGVGWRS
jgi:TP901 family phage tail tape measure protein